MLATTTSASGSSSRSTSARATSSSTPFARAVSAATSTATVVEIDGADRSEPEPRRPRQRRHPSRSRRREGFRARAAASSSMHARVVGCAPVPNARPGSTTTASSPAGGAIHGGPIQSPPARTGRWNSFQRSSHPPATGSTRRLREGRRGSPPRRASSVYTASSTSRRLPRAPRTRPESARRATRARSRPPRVGTLNATRTRPLSAARSSGG